jgi:hypothetical protein
MNLLGEINNLTRSMKCIYPQNTVEMDLKLFEQCSYIANSLAISLWIRHLKIEILCPLMQNSIHVTKRTKCFDQQHSSETSAAGAAVALSVNES